MEQLRVPGELDSLSIIGKYVLETAVAAGLDKKAAYRLRLAVDEIATNIIVHGYEESGEKGEIEVVGTIDEQALTITLEDTAPKYDPRMQEDPDDLELPLEHRRIGGLGVYLAFNGVDKFIYEHIGTGNRNSFVMYRNKAT